VTLCDASPLVALINKSDSQHQKCVNALRFLQGQLVTTWACLTEAMYLLGTYGGFAAQKQLWGYVLDHTVFMHDISRAEQERMYALMMRYQDTPMDLADASLVACAETLNQQRIFTLDSDFYIYRFKDTEAFEVIP
jgi:predicted nucleic acid-binding protein